MLHHAGGRSRPSDRGRRRRALGRTAAALAVMGVCAGATTACVGDESQAAASPTSGGLPVSYEPAKGGAGAEGRAFLMERRIPERVARAVGERVRLPADVKIVARSCGDSEQDVYDAETGRIVICYGSVAEIRGMFEEALGEALGDGADDGADDGDSRRAVDAKTAGVLTETLYHEIAHALKDKLRLPVTGREEDVADQFAAYSLIPEGSSGVAAILDAAESYTLYARDTDPEDVDFSDEHSPDAARAANYRCYVYGSAPARHKKLVDGETLTKERAELCEGEYQDLRRGWDALLKPYRVSR
ncbi:DUF4344 domain-containing metallopeptidase [Streptomyces sp. NPDC050610]|uniref:DUF4344 domain-containing metallopeptidase n=1 Tax=Streptomyces sp. NPDC050610 TaxID=3157097 RepID=UPI00343F9013